MGPTNKYVCSDPAGAGGRRVIPSHKESGTVIRGEGLMRQGGLKLGGKR